MWELVFLQLENIFFLNKLSPFIPQQFHTIFRRLSLFICTANEQKRGKNGTKYIWNTVTWRILSGCQYITNQTNYDTCKPRLLPESVERDKFECLWWILSVLAANRDPYPKKMCYRMIFIAHFEQMNMILDLYTRKKLLKHWVKDHICGADDFDYFFHEVIIFSVYEDRRTLYSSNNDH